MRIVNRVLAVMVSLALILGAAVLVIEVVAQRIGSAPVVFDWPAAFRWAQQTSWGDAPVKLISVLLVIAGLALLIAQLVPRRLEHLALDNGGTPTETTVTRRGLARTVRRTLTDIDGVSDAAVTIRKRRVRVEVQTRPDQPEAASSMRDTVARAAQERLNAIQLQRPPALKVRVSTRER